MKKIDIPFTVATVHGLMAEKGFWPEVKTTRNVGEALMLAVGELGEGQEAHRTDQHLKHESRKYSMEDFLDGLAYENFDVENPVFEDDDRKAIYKKLFTRHIKDTLEDEVADTYYRLADFIGGFGLGLSFVEKYRNYATENYKKFTKEGHMKPFSESDDNIGAELLMIAGSIYNAYSAYGNGDQQSMTETLGFALGQLEVFAHRWGMDLEWHIKYKHLCNAGRGYKYGKSY